MTVSSSWHSCGTTRHRTKTLGVGIAWRNGANTETDAVEDETGWMSRRFACTGMLFLFLALTDSTRHSPSLCGLLHGTHAQTLLFDRFGRGFCLNSPSGALCTARTGPVQVSGCVDGLKLLDMLSISVCSVKIPSTAQT